MARSHGRERERLAVLCARRAGAWWEEVRWRFERANAVPRRQLRDDCHDVRRLQLHARSREGRRRGSDAAIDARTVMLMLPGRVRVARGAVLCVMPSGMVRWLAVAVRGQLRRRARVHRTDVHDRGFADAEDEPDGEQCAEHASEVKAAHSVGKYVGRQSIGIFRIAGGLAEWLMHRS